MRISRFLSSLQYLHLNGSHAMHLDRLEQQMTARGDRLLLMIYL